MKRFIVQSPSNFFIKVELLFGCRCISKIAS